jgi:small subunit ribosomal protein S17
MARTLTGVVTSDKPNKTVIISVTARKTHPLYKKQYTASTKFMVHDEKNEAKVGDLIVVTETRPLSARKHFSLIKILQRAGAHFEETDAIADVLVEEAPEPSTGSKAKAAKEKSTKTEKAREET